MRRYLSNFHASRVGHILTDVLVVGGGVAGARAAIEAGRQCQVILISKGRLDDGATRLAQGGIAAAIGPDDSFAQHIEDTLRVGCGLNRRSTVQQVIRDAPARVQELLEWGFAADRAAPPDTRTPSGEHGLSDAGLPIALTREGGHTRFRVIHAHGDATGAELSRTLLTQLKRCTNVRLFEHCFLIDLLTLNGACLGAVTFHAKYGHQIIWAAQTILAGGGCGRVYRETTNPPVATGDLIAAAWRAGACIRDMEFVQFHPTTLYVAGAGRALISEAVRGEGAYLVDRHGERFMSRYHPDGELAPRDIVSRAITHHLRETRANCVYLDARHLRGFRERFPFITRLCEDFQIDVTRDLIPVRPSAHYLVGGIETDLNARTSIDGLLACGECAWTGLHGANRLASNSLLEGLVFGAVAGRTASASVRRDSGTMTLRAVENQNPPSQRTELDLDDIRNSLRSLMWRNVGIERDATTLNEALAAMEFWGHYVLAQTFNDPAGWEVQNMLTVGRMIVQSALRRETSIGVHFRTDAPREPSPADLYHTCISRQFANEVRCLPVEP